MNSAGNGVGTVGYNVQPGGGGHQESLDRGPSGNKPRAPRTHLPEMPRLWRGCGLRSVLTSARAHRGGNNVYRGQDARLHALTLAIVDGSPFDGELVALELHSAVRLRSHTVADLHAHRFGLETCDGRRLSAHVHEQKPHKEV